MRPSGDGVELTPQPGLDRLDALLDEIGRAGLPARLHVEGEPSRFLERSTSPPTGSSRKD